MICFTNENSISSSLYEILDPFKNFVIFPSLLHAIHAAGALPEKEEHSRPGTLKEKGKQLNLDSNRTCHALQLSLRVPLKPDDFLYSINILIKNNKQ